MNALLQQFITEARDLLEEAANSLLALETAPNDKNGVNAVFRAAHTLKGSTGLFDVLPMTKVVHAAEDILDAVKADKVSINSELIDLLLDAFDQVGIWIDELESNESLPSSAANIGTFVSERLREWLAKAQGQATPAPTQKPMETLTQNLSLVQAAPVNQQPPAPQADWLLEIDPVLRAKAFELAMAGKSLLTLSYIPEPECYFKGEDPFGLVLQLPNLLGVSVNLAQPVTLSDETDVYQANLKLVALAEVDMTEAEHLFRYVAEQVTLSVPTAQAWLIPHGELDNDGILNDIVDKMDQCFADEDFAGITTSIAVAKHIVRPNSWAAHTLGLMQLVLDCAHPQSMNWLAKLKDSLVSGQAPVWKETQQAVHSSNLAAPAFTAQELEPSKDAESMAVIVGLQIALLQAPVLPELRLGKIVSVAKIIENLIQRLNQPELAQSWLAVVGRAKSSLQTDILVQWLEQSALNQPYAVHYAAPVIAEPVSISEASAQALLQTQHDILTHASNHDPLLTGKLKSIKSVITAVLIGQNKAQALTRLDAIVEECVAEQSTDALLAWLAQHLMGKVECASTASIDSTELGETNSLVQNANTSNDTNQPDQTGNSGESGVAKTLRVEQASIDKLGDLIGELVVAKNAMPYLALRAERDFGVPELAKLLKEQFNVVDRLTQELQGTIMKVQMLPVSQIFQRFPRLVRDISRKLGKKINLVLEGEETQADKTVIEVMSDPMIHMVRNSLDHGLETPEARLAAGKSETGTLKLKAYQEGDSVIIEIQDDGRGINPAIVKQKALEKGLISTEQAQSMTDQEAIYIIFQPGFSTNDAVTDLSGRGVGMDVVRSTIERIGGGLSVESKVGIGTNIRLSLPLSMAVSHVMEIELADQIFGVPMDMVVETARLAPKQINRIKQREAFVWRSRLVPLVRLRRAMRLPAHTPRTDGSESVLVVRKDGGLIGLVVDDFRSKAEVIMKPLEGPLSGIPLYAGSALLGDGSVMLVLNVGGIAI